MKPVLPTRELASTRLLDSLRIAPPSSAQQSFSASRHVWVHVALVPLVLVLLASLASSSGFDRAVSDLFFDASRSRFPAHESFWLELLGHRIAKAAIWVVAIGVLAAAVAVQYGRAAPLDRRALWVTLLAMGLGPLIVFLLKQTTGHHCPWDLKDYGGFADFTHEWFVARADAGRCFPSGHASAGFALIALSFLGTAINRPWLAHSGLIAAIVVGTAFSVVRVVQGAHFVSHNLWAAAIDWCAAALVFAPLLLRRRQ